MSELRIVSFREIVEPQSTQPGPDRLLVGAPQIRTWNHYEEASGQFFAGIWAASSGTWRVRYSEHEFCHLLSGRVRIIASDGTRHEFAAGDSFVIPAGFEGIWEVLEDCRKLYAIFEPRLTDQHH